VRNIGPDIVQMRNTTGYWTRHLLKGPILLSCSATLRIYGDQLFETNDLNLRRMPNVRSLCVAGIPLAFELRGTKNDAGFR